LAEGSEGSNKKPRPSGLPNGNLCGQDHSYQFGLRRTFGWCHRLCVGIRRHLVI